MAELEKESEASVEQHARLRQENLHLVHRANALEEQLKEQELHADEQLQQENRRQKEALTKLERERGLELENLQGRYAEDWAANAASLVAAGKLFLFICCTTDERLVSQWLRAAALYCHPMALTHHCCCSVSMDVIK